MLDKNDQRGLGGTLLEDIEESLPNCEKQLKVLISNTFAVTLEKYQVEFDSDLEIYML